MTDVDSVEVLPPASFAGVLSAAIQQRGLSLERIRARLEAAGVPVSIATLSYWQSGRSLPTRARSYHTLVELEKILHLDSGTLTIFTYTTVGRRRRALFPWENVVPLSEMATEIVDGLGIDTRGQLTRVTMQEVLQIRADRSEDFQLSSVLWRAERNGQHRWPLVVEQDAEDDPAVPTIEVLCGCAIGQVIEVPERHLVVAEMRAPRPLRRGEYLLAQYRTKFARTRRASRRLACSVIDPVRALSLVAQFDERALPAKVDYTFQKLADPEPVTVTPVDVATGEAQMTKIDTNPGIYSLEWEWD